MGVRQAAVYYHKRMDGAVTVLFIGEEVIAYDADSGEQFRQVFVYYSGFTYTATRLRQERAARLAKAELDRVVADYQPGWAAK